MAKTDLVSLDAQIGQRMRAFRRQKTLSQQKLADRLGVTSQQVQKYENGTDRIGAGLLQVIADILGVTIYEFFIVAARQPMRSNLLFKMRHRATAPSLPRVYSRIRQPKLQ
jgi:transcriptional regulator with XRE-family HTH domain